MFFNPRPGRTFFITRPGRGGGRCDPPGVSKLSVVALRNQDQSIALNEYSRLVIYLLTLGQYLTQLWQVKGQISGKTYNFPNYLANTGESMKDSDMKISRPCFSAN